MNWSQAIESYTQYLKVERRYSDHTLGSYIGQLKQIARYCLSKNILTLSDLTHSETQTMFAHFHREGLSGKSLQLRLSALRGMFRFLNRHKLNDDPTLDIQLPKVGKRLPGVLDIEEVNQLLSNTAVTPGDIRDRAIAELFYATGMRLSELQQLNLEDIDADTGLIRVLGKGSKTRLVPFGDYAQRALDAWLNLRNPKSESEKAVFLNNQGNRISTRGIQLRLKQLGVKTGQNQNIHPHKLRHAFASHVLESSNDLRAVQDLLGHANIGTTQVYTHLNFQHLASVLDAAHPRAKRKENK